MLRSGAPDLILSDALPLLDMIIMDEYGRLPDVAAEIFNEEGSSKWGEQDTSFAGVGAVPESAEGESLSYENPSQGYDKTYTHLTYKLGVAFSEEMVEDEKFGLISKTYKGLGMSMYQTTQIVCAAIFNDGFGDTGPDGSSLFNATHSLITGGTYGNRPATDVDLSMAGLKEMDVDLMNQVDDRNLNVFLQAETILAPPDLKQTLFELIKSQDRPDTANRSVNVYHENYKPIIWPYLTSTSAWFALANKSQHNLKKFNRVAPYTKSEQDFDTGDVKTKMRCRFSVGYSAWFGVWGSNP